MAARSNSRLSVIDRHHSEYFHLFARDSQFTPTGIVAGHPILKNLS
jgi:hypothetical protein